MIAAGKYTGKDGVEKTSWKEIGVIMTSQAGKDFVLLDPTVNLAGFPREPGKDKLIASIFDDQAQGHQAQQQGHSTSNGTNNPSPTQQQGYNQSQNPPPAQYLPQQNHNTMPQQNQQGSYPVVDDATGQNIPFSPIAKGL